MKARTSYRHPFHWVSDIVAVWHDTRLIVLTAQVAAIYAAILIPFKVGIPIIPGFVELRPANAIPIVTSLLFGPAAAWGAGIGNIIGDCFGTLGPASVFGFLGNFFLAYVPHVLWGRLGPLSSGKAPHMKSWRQGLEFVVICVIASGVCAATIAWGVELLGLLPFMILAPAIFLNNVIMGVFLGPPLLMFLYPRVKRWGLYYQDLREDLRNMQHEKKSHTSMEEQDKEDVSGEESFPMVEIKNVTFRYRGCDNPALQGLSLKVEAGEWVVLMGERGSGKSTLCHSLNGLIPRFIPGSFSGTIRVNGQDSARFPVSYQAGKVGIVFQDFDTQLISTNVERELVFPLEYVEPSLPDYEMTTQIHWAMKEVGLDNFYHRDPLSLSGGQRQRLVLAAALVSRPPLLVLDQPMTDLDPEARTTLRKLFKTLKEKGGTIVLSEQESEEVLLADRLCVLSHGSVCWEGPPRKLFQQPDLVRRYGLFTLPLTECFIDLGLPTLPVTLDEAWNLAKEYGLTLEPGQEILERDHGVSDWESGNRHPVPLVRLERVGFGYTKDVPVVQDISLTITRGEFVAVLGKNGSGKSTLGKLLNGLLIPTTGDILVSGLHTTTSSISDLSRVVGYVFQNPDHQIFAESVWKEVGFSVRNLGLSEEECERRIVEALTAVGLDIHSSKSQDPFSLTKGERQRVAVASILATRPDVLIFDEPTTGLDARETERMMKMIRRLHHGGHTIIMITHTIRLVSEYATRCVLMSKGGVLADGSTRSVFANPSILQEASLEVPSLTRFSQRWGYTLLTVAEVKKSLKWP